MWVTLHGYIHPTQFWLQDVCTSTLHYVFDRCTGFLKAKFCTDDWCHTWVNTVHLYNDILSVCEVHAAVEAGCWEYTCTCTWAIQLLIQHVSLLCVHVMVRYIWAPYRALELALLERYSEKYSAWATAAESTDKEVVHLIWTMMIMMMMMIIMMMVIMMMMMIIMMMVIMMMMMMMTMMMMMMMMRNAYLPKKNLLQTRSSFHHCRAEASQPSLVGVFNPSQKDESKVIIIPALDGRYLVCLK